MKWFAENPHGPHPGVRGELAWDVHNLGRSWFPSGIARGGGFASTAFAPTTGEAMRAPFRRKLDYGSAGHMANLRRMQAADPNNLNIKKAIDKASQGPGRASSLKHAARLGIGAAFVALPAFVTPGSGQEKARATAGALVGQVGWEVGTRVGMSVGAGVGSAILPGIGTAVGAAAGYLIGGVAGAIGFDEGFQALTRIPDRMVEKERARRNLNWKNDMSAFQTRRASTMRQMSLQAMSRGQMNARSMLGREGVMLHQ